MVKNNNLSLIVQSGLFTFDGMQANITTSALQICSGFTSIRPLFLLATRDCHQMNFKASPIITNINPDEFQSLTWGLVPWWMKSREDAEMMRARTLNAISEEIFEKAAFKDVAKDGKRCLIPCTGFYEWRWVNEGRPNIPISSTCLVSLYFLLGDCGPDGPTGQQESTEVPMPC
jgi:hypothetical protein